MKLINGSRKQTIVRLRRSMDKLAKRVELRQCQIAALEMETTGGMLCAATLRHPGMAYNCGRYALDDSRYCIYHDERYHKGEDGSMILSSLAPSDRVIRKCVDCGADYHPPAHLSERCSGCQEKNRKAIAKRALEKFKAKKQRAQNAR
jgi:hypothetical protein